MQPTLRLYTGIQSKNPVSTNKQTLNFHFYYFFLLKKKLLSVNEE